MPLRTRLTNRFRIEHPIISAPISNLVIALLGVQAACSWAQNRPSGE